MPEKKMTRAQRRQAEKKAQLKSLSEDAQRALEKRQNETQIMIEEFMKEFDKDGDGDLEADEVRQLLVRTCKSGDPSEENLAACMARVPEGGLTKETMAIEFVKLKGYLEQEMYIDKTMAEFDDDGSGFIGRHELSILMTRMASGKMPAIRDVDFVLFKCDRGSKAKAAVKENGQLRRRQSVFNDGQIDRTEILPVISLWKRILIERAKGKDPVEEYFQKRKEWACVVS